MKSKLRVLLFKQLIFLWLLVFGLPLLAKITVKPSADEKMKMSHIQGNKEFDAYKNKFIARLWQHFPLWASQVGMHAYDEALTFPGPKRWYGIVSFAENELAALEKYKIPGLTPENMVDAELIAGFLKRLVWQMKELKEYHWNPADYNVGEAFDEILNGSYAPAKTRFKALAVKIKKVPEYYRYAQESIQDATLEHTQLAIEQHHGTLELFHGPLREGMKASPLNAAEKKAFDNDISKAVGAIQTFIVYLENLKKNLEKNGARSFRLGEKLYEQKFAHEIASNMTAKQLYEAALEEKRKTYEKLYALAPELWQKYFKGVEAPEDKKAMLRQLVDKVSMEQVPRDQFVEAIKAQIPQLSAFVKEHKLLHLDEDKPLEVRETPKYMRGVAGASISAPGPYDAKAKTYYNVTPLDDFSDEQAASYLREYNKYMLQILNIHEGIPGHYAQLVYANKSPSLIKAILGNSAMIEGWAVYTERMMLEEGYGNDQPELWLMYYKWYLRVVTNTILDYSVHVLGMNEEDAMRLLIDDAFQQKQEAQGKWRRVTLSQVQLTSYFSGFKDIYDFREKKKAELGDQFNLADFHEKILRHGNAPVKYSTQLF